MAHPYSTTPFYAGTPSYAPQQPYYSSFPNTLQQSIHTPPGIPQQPSQPPPSYQPSPPSNGARFDANPQVRPPAPPFPQFPPTTTALTADFFKQFAGAGLPAGLPPPPLPSFPPMPLPNTGYPQFPVTVNAPGPSPFPQHIAPGTQSVSAGFNMNDQVRHDLSDSFLASQSGSRGGGDSQASTKPEPQPYGTSHAGQGGTSHTAHAAARSIDLDQDQSLPSFGSRSDIDLLFANAQKEAMQRANELTTGTTKEDLSVDITTYQTAGGDGNASPYDPSRPAPIHDSTSGSLGLSSDSSKAQTLKPFERNYDNKSLTELRQLAKGALLSLVPHKILYADLLKEGVNPQILQELYGELGLKTESDQTKQPEGTDSRAFPQNDNSSVPLQEADLGTHEPQTSAQEYSPKSHAQSLQVPSTGSISGTVNYQNETVPSPAILDLRKQQSAPSPSLERKDRIAQLLAAKTGRPSAATPPTASPSQKEEPVLIASTMKPVESTLTASASYSPPGIQQPSYTTQQSQNSLTNTAQSELVRQRMEQLRRETLVKAESKPEEAIPSDATSCYTQSTSDAPKVSSQPGNAFSSSIDSAQSQPALPSMIPGLFMTSTGPSGFDEESERAPEATGDMTGASENEHINHDAYTPSKPNITLSSTALMKRPLTFDSAASDVEPASKRPNIQQQQQQPFPNLTSFTQPVVADDDQSEGEIVEEPESDVMAMGSESESIQEGYEPSRGRSAPETSLVQNQTSFNESLTAPPPATESGSEDLYRAKQTKIEELRRKIAEMEQRTKLKRTRSQVESPASSNPPTPAITREEQPLSSSPVQRFSGQGGSNISSNPLQRQPIGPRNISKLTPAQLAERAASLKADLLKQRAQRQQVLQEGLPDLNAEVQKTESRLNEARSRLAQARTEVENYQAGLERSIKTENELAAEVARLEKQLQEDRSGQKQYSDELQQIKLEKLAEDQESRARELSQTVPQPSALTSNMPDSSSAVDNFQPSGHTGDVSLDSASKPPSLSAVALDSTIPVGSTAGAEVPVSLNGQVHESASPNSFTSALRSQDQVEREEEFEFPPRTDSLQADEMEISPEPEYEPAQGTTLPTTIDSRRQSNDSSMDMDNDSDGSASMSDSGEEGEVEEDDYKPTDADISQPMQESDDDSDEYDPEEAPVQDLTPNTGLEDEDQDFYEPAENVDAIKTPPVDGLANEYVEEIPAVPAASADTRPDDIESGAEPDTSTKAQDAPNDENAENRPFLDGTSPPPTHYIPYKTPLSAFKTYRFHPEFHDKVKSGYRSLTYSNNIDPSRTLCPTELSGETCNDPTCEEQHFSQMGLPDDKILIQMSSASDIQDKEARDQFLVGLKQVIADLRAREVKEFESVADALSAYRRKFFAEKEEDS
ncbi:uncharacterized protein Z518_01216 [Rhinocladiella mackenziei CBS 650.93]|uniref:Putative zinc-finger domain-containing protein n=1 Tax=Rhinocladiella mackenziei CBS 650.93 TaxID=1442369 RepID=A0A0D2JKZ1_9EURO|nr:uncharacterized protein Z518_01216 [Rhinocladiella mackenziei CBS 650.93]KIX10135.1 hypothetical protein Z518_01216 [Rhinocladiella mackenziei CBS 650.93]